MSGAQLFVDFLKTQIGLEVGSVGISVIERAVRQRISAVPGRTADEYWQALQHSAPEQQALITDLFERIMEAVDSGANGIQDYTVQQSSLEQVFLRIARLGEEEEEDKNEEDGEEKAGGEDVEAEATEEVEEEEEQVEEEHSAVEVVEHELQWS